MINVGIVGGTGYTGVELLRQLASHPEAQVRVITSRSDAGTSVADMFPNLRGHFDDLRFSEPDVKALGACDVVFFATPHGVAHALAAELLAEGTRVIDLSADFRLQDAEEWSHWYGQPHGAVELLPEAVYGLPEVNREQIKTARLIAVPGCYPTAVQLGFLPLLEAGVIETDGLIADCKSGVSGAGRGAKVGSLLCEASENMKAYGMPAHRHLPEIRQGMRRAAQHDVELTFVPHLTPMTRGIHATLHARLNGNSLKLKDVDIQGIFDTRFASEPCVDVLPQGHCPETRSVRGTNMCRIAVFRPEGGRQLVVMSVIDNLVKGASGQAIQNMNLMFGLNETSGLQQIALLP